MRDREETINDLKRVHDSGFNIPVKRKIGLGRYQKGWAKSLVPVNGKIKIRFDSGRRSSWAAEVTEHEPRGFNVKQ
jgi:hypothetical protein